MKILAKLLVGFLAVAALCGVVGIVGVTQFGRMIQSLERIEMETIPTLNTLYSLQGEVLKIKTVVRTVANPLGAGNETFIQRQKSNFETARAAQNKYIEEFEKIQMVKEEEKLWQATKEQLAKAKAYNDSVWLLVDQAQRTEDPEVRAALYGKLFEKIDGAERTVFDDYISNLQKVIDFDIAYYGVDLPNQAQRSAEAGRTILVAVTILSFLVAVILGILLGSSISRSLRKAVAVLGKLAEGDTDAKFDHKGRDEFRQVADAIAVVQKNIDSLITEADRITDMATLGRLTERADPSAFKGKYHALVKGFNEVIGTLVGFIESLPVPMMVIDREYHILYMNKAGASLGGTSGDQLASTRRQCYDFFRTGDCKTENCACAKAMQINGQAQSETEARPGTQRLDINYIGVPIHDRQGEVSGALEIVIDQTAIKMSQRKIEKISAFQGTEIERLTGNLFKIAAGDLTCDFTLAESDEDTRDVYERFEKIRDALKVSVGAIHALVADANMLAQAAVEGRLATRADASKHQGDFRKIVEGVNRTLDLVITPINETIAIMKHMSEGDLTALMTGDYKGDFDELKKALSASLDSINELLGQVNVAVEQVAGGAGQVSQASQALSQGATEQASSLEEITSSITEVSSQTKQNTESAIQVTDLAKTAKDDAERGNQQMKELVAAMNDINQSAEEIRKIVKAIDDISFQINLLALNANVEAARAGKYGKGFAVVAEEVRNLAVRSASSVKDTTRMVDEAIANIEKGNSLVDVTAKQLSSIVEGASKVAVLAEEVATAGKEQSQGLEQITLGLNQIDQVTQANTASAEESASAAEELSSQAQQLKAMLGRFKLRVSDKTLNNAEMIQMLKAELARQGGQRTAPALSIAPRTDPGKPKKPAQAARVNPAEVIALDDDNFGKF